MKNKAVLTKILRVAISLLFWMIIWEIASLLVNDSLKIFLPQPIIVFKKWFELLFTKKYYFACAATLLRIFTGFLTGIICGILCGIFTSECKTADLLISPALRIIRAVPVVSFIILAFLFINVNRLPVFISFLMVVPLIWQSTHNSLQNTDVKLCEMGKVFGMSRMKILLSIKFPDAFSEIITACVNGMGLAWKSGVAAEVLCTPEISIGKSIYRAKGNLNFDEVYALTLTVVILSLIFEFALKAICKKASQSRKEKYNA